ncbi:hypothetical protein EOT00_06450 [Listeria seeligeri]|uniref:hypothetical protein n=1 Tax=Listeria seeligeri TaxID=1640 RepID=UPI00111A9CBA|nr:hypothetical protein [Listeria seeligeri]QDA74597.1 hypothetical protein EOT00_06450 [Listeria seeligeri]
MTQKSIEEVKFEEAKKLVAEIQTIATFNENITCAVNISFNDGKGVHSASSALGGAVNGFKKFKQEAKENSDENN